MNIKEEFGITVEQMQASLPNLPSGGKRGPKPVVSYANVLAYIYDDAGERRQLTYAELAEKWGCSRQAAHQLTHNALKALLDVVDESGKTE